VHITNKPFPLLYEEIASYAVKNNYSEKEVLKSIGDFALKIGSNNYYYDFVSLFQRIFTTNYDYSLEKSLQRNEIPKSETKETRYSLYRKININQKEIWHIHGEAKYPNTICLGYDHYSGYLQNIRQHLTTRGIQREIKESVATRLRNKKLIPNTWMEYFFISDIYIIGLDLDFVETELWWLLVYRHRLKQHKKVSIGNTIKFYDNVAEEKKRKIKHELLSALGVDVVTYNSIKNYEHFYQKILRSLEKE
jgi:hypothetical protein